MVPEDNGTQIISPSYYPPLERPLGSWNRANGSTWNARKRKWNALGLLEQSLRLYLERALAQMERFLGIWNRASGSIWNAL